MTMRLLSITKYSSAVIINIHHFDHYYKQHQIEGLSRSQMAGVSISQRSRTRRAAKRDPRKLCVGKNLVMKYSSLRFSVSLKLSHLQSHFAQHTCIYIIYCRLYYVILCILYHDNNYLCIYMHQLISPVCPMRCIPWRPHNRDPMIGSALVRIFHCKAFLHKSDNVVLMGRHKSLI